LSNEVDVQFRTEEPSVGPANPNYLKAFAKALHLCGAAEYMESAENDAEMVRWKKGVCGEWGNGIQSCVVLAPRAAKQTKAILAGVLLVQYCSC
jgi:hypothetical protein